MTHPLGEMRMFSLVDLILHLKPSISIANVLNDSMFGMCGLGNDALMGTQSSK